MKKVIDYLVELGLSEVESRLYEGLLDYGPCAVLDLANKLNMNRITVHSNIENLKKKGLVTESRNGARRLLLAEPPDRLKYFIEKKEESVNKLKENFSDILLTINSSLSNPRQSDDVNVKYYEGKEGVELVYKEILRADTIYSFVNVNKIKEVFPDNIKHFQNAMKINKKMHMYEIVEDLSNARDFIKNLHPRYHCKFTPKDVTFTNIDLIIFDDKVALITLEDKLSAILISSSTIVNMMKAIHDVMWRIL
jgi:predicted transcriptional regulator